MALTGGTTTNLSLKKCAETEPYDTDWAEDFNDNLDIIDGVPDITVGGTITGDLNIVQAAATAQLKVKGTGGTYNYSTLTLESDEGTDKAWTFIHRKHTDYPNGFIMQYFDGSNYYDRAILKSTGELVVANGVAPGPLASSILKTANVQLNNAEIKGLRAAPKELVATPGANYWLELEKVMLILGAGSEALTETADNLVVEYGTSGFDATAAIEMTGFIDQISNTIISASGVDLTAQALTNVLNNNLRLKNTGDGEFAGNASSDAWMEIIVRYWIHPKIV